MELEKMYPISLAFSLVLILTCAWKILDNLWWKPKRIEQYLRNQGLQGITYRLWGGDPQETEELLAEQSQSKPINISQDIVPHVVPFFYHITQKYGKVSFFWHKTTPMLILRDPEMIREAFLKNHVFTKEFANMSFFISGLAFQEGEKWVKHRKILNPAFHLEKLKLMLPAMTISCGEMLNEWEKLVRTKGPCEVDIWPSLEKFSADVISRTAFRSCYEQGETVFKLIKQQAQILLQLIQAKWRYFQIRKIKKMKEIHLDIKNRIRDIILQKEQAMKGEKVENKDLLSLLLESNSKEIEEHENKDVGMTLDEVIEECKLFYFAGQETTASLLVWTMVMLGVHQDWQIRAREEVFQVFGKNKPHFEGLHHLKIISMILYEVLRLYPPAPRIKRITKQATKLGDINLPSGMELEIPIILIHHDTDLWGDDAKEFKPDRFAEGVARATTNKPIFIPFASGPRICIGQNFAMTESKMAISMILQQFSFELSPSYDHAPFSLMSLQPRYGAKMILQKI